MQASRNLSEFKETAQEMASRTLFLQQLVDMIEERIYSECLTEDYVCLNIEYADGWIEVYMKSYGTCDVAVYHSKNEHESPTLEATITGMLPDWWSIHTRAEEDDRAEQEFQDYLWTNCRYW